MLQVNYYKKVCQLTDSEKDKINEFFKTLCEVENISSINIYISNGDTYCEIEGIDTPMNRVVGSNRKHDKEIM